MLCVFYTIFEKNMEATVSLLSSSKPGLLAEFLLYLRPLSLKG